MKDLGFLTAGKHLTLSTPEGSAFNFTIKISESENPTCSFEIQCNHQTEDSVKTCFYEISDREHHSYLDLFEKLSRDLGLRLPQNREKNQYTTANDTPLNEVITTNLVPGILYGYGDPAVIRVENKTEPCYYLVVTSNDAPNSFPILRSKDLNHWEFVSFVFPEGSKPEWAADGEFISDYWAAEMHQVGDEFRVYFVARDKENLELCIGLAVSSSPEGPFIAAPHPILKGNIIDPHIFIKGPNITYLYWKEDNNDVWPGKLIELLYNHPHLVTSLFDKQEDQLTAVFIKTLWPWTSTLPPMERFLVLQVLIEVIIANFSSFYKRLSELLRTEHKSLHDDIKTVLQFMKTPMYAQQLSPDGLRFEGERIRILENDLDWEAHLVEGMWVTQHLDSYYLFYAGNDFSTDQYGIGVAIGKSPLGPFTKMQTPFLRSTTKWWAPGHPSIVTDTQGVQTMFLHAYFPGKAGYKEFRALLSTPLTFKEDEVLLGV